MSRVAIRAAGPQDSTAISGLAGQLGYERSPDEIEDWINTSLVDRIALVAEVDGVVAGWVEAHDLDLLIHPRVLEIGGLVVADGERGRGIGKSLVEAVTQWGREHGHREVWVRSNVVRERAHGFYEDLGFNRVKTSHSFSRRID